jgi:hypothetical protein
MPSHPRYVATSGVLTTKQTIKLGSDKKSAIHFALYRH